MYPYSTAVFVYEQATLYGHTISGLCVEALRVWRTVLVASLFTASRETRSFLFSANTQAR